MKVHKTQFCSLLPKSYINFLTILPAFLISILISSCDSLNSSRDKDEVYVVMLSLDAFRWDFTDKFHTPNFDKLASNGVKAEGLIPCFPTKTFPNHYSMITGLHPDHHGIVQNSFYDAEMNRFYSIGNREAVEDGSFYGGEPIWVTAENQGVKSASYFWVGSEAPSGGRHPSMWKKYEHDFPFEQRIDTVISWLKLPGEARPHLITFYMHEPDSKAHYLGPDNPELGETIVYLDSLVGDLMKKMDDLEISSKINLIITSDHGMCPVSPERYIDLSDHLDSSWVDIIIGYNPNYLVQAREGYYDSIETKLEKIPHVSAWPSKNVPERFVYGNNPRTLDFVFLADSAWSIGWMREANPHSRGAHGFDNANTDMHGIFYARGPKFKNGYSQSRFSNTDLYSIIAELLNLDPADTDGDLDNVWSMLRK